MKLREIKTELHHFFLDDQDRYQGEYKDWWDNGQQWVISHFRDDELHGDYKDWWDNGQQRVVCNFQDSKLHGEYKWWNSSGKLINHTFHIDGNEIIDFLENPELYPKTPEEKLIFVLKYGNSPFIGETE